MRPFLILAAVVMTTAAQADPCRVGTSRPGIDVDPAQRIDPAAPRMRCTQTVTTVRDPAGRERMVRRWDFAIRNGTRN